MQKESKKPQIVAGLATVLLIGSVFFLSMQINTNDQLEERLNEEKLKAETMLSEKLLLEKDLNKFQNDISALQGKNKDLDKILNETSGKLKVKENGIRQIQKQNASLASYKKQYDDLLKIKNDLVKELENYTTSLARLKSTNEDLKQTLASLEQKNQILRDNLMAQSAFINSSKVESTKKNDRLTVSARRTKKISVNVSVPSNSENVRFKIKDPSGNVLSQKDGTITSRVLGNTALVASTTAGPYANMMKEIEMVFTPNKKLEAGLYTIDVYSGNSNEETLGSLQVRFK